MRTKRSILNLITDVIPLIVISFLGIFKLKLFISFLGDETLGLYQLYSQIMVYIALVDGGLSSALLYALYKPNSDKDSKTFNSIIIAAQRVFSLIGTIIFGITLLASPFVSFFIKNSIFSNQYIIFTFLLFSLSNIIEYFFVPYRSILEVKEKKYLVNLCIQGGQIVLNIAEIVMLILGCPFFLILLMHSVIKLISNILVALICKKYYPIEKKCNTKANYGFVSQIKHLVFHKINGLISYNIDIVLISKFLGLASVAIYSTYNYIINMFRNILGKFSSSITAIVGNYLATGKNEENYKLFKEIKSMTFFIGTILCVPLLFALNNFIDIWYEGDILTSSFLALSFSIYLFVYVVKMPTTLYVTSAGLFKETKFCALTDTIINLVLSLALIFVFGIPGVIIATTISAFVAEYCMKTNVIYKHIFKMNSLKFHLENIKFIIIIVLDILLGYIIFNNIEVTNIFSWFVVNTVYFIINSALVFITYFLLKETTFINRFKKLLVGRKK